MIVQVHTRIPIQPFDCVSQSKYDLSQHIIQYFFDN